LFLDYADTPVETTTGIGLSNRQFVATALAGFGITKDLQISISVPYLFDQGGKRIDLTSDVTSWRFGDVSIAGKYRVLNEKQVGIGLAVSPFVVLNTGQEDDWFGNNSFSGGLKLILDKNLNKKTAITLNIGYQIKKKEQLTSTQRIEDMILYGLGVSYALTEQLTLIGEVYGYTAATSAFEKYLSPLEGDISLAYKIWPQCQFTLGGGGAITKGVGAPEWRILTGIRFGF
ncbi:MAG: transporter, partial [bacterium]